MDSIPYFFESVDRSAVLIKLKQPFFDWINSLEPKNTVKPPVEATFYLVKQKGTDSDVERWLKRNFDKIFVNELNDWWTDEDDWPKKRTFNLFNEWFDWQAGACVLDTEETDLI